MHLFLSPSVPASLPFLSFSISHLGLAVPDSVRPGPLPVHRGGILRHSSRSARRGRAARLPDRHGHATPPGATVESELRGRRDQRAAGGGGRQSELRGVRAGESRPRGSMERRLRSGYWVDADRPWNRPLTSRERASRCRIPRDALPPPEPACRQPRAEPRPHARTLRGWARPALLGVGPRAKRQRTRERDCKAVTREFDSAAAPAWAGQAGRRRRDAGGERRGEG
jgi:hypothetical protein